MTSKCKITTETREYVKTNGEWATYTVQTMTVPDDWELWEEPDFEGNKL